MFGKSDSLSPELEGASTTSSSVVASPVSEASEGWETLTPSPDHHASVEPTPQDPAFPLHRG